VSATILGIPLYPRLLNYEFKLSYGETKISGISDLSIVMVDLSGSSYEIFYEA